MYATVSVCPSCLMRLTYHTKWKRGLYYAVAMSVCLPIRMSLETCTLKRPGFSQKPSVSSYGLCWRPIGSPTWLFKENHRWPQATANLPTVYNNKLISRRTLRANSNYRLNREVRDITVKLYHPYAQFSRNVRLSHRRIATFSAHRHFCLLRLINPLTYLLTSLLQRLKISVCL